MNMFVDKWTCSLITCYFLVHHYWMESPEVVHEDPCTVQQPATNLQVDVTIKKSETLFFTSVNKERKVILLEINVTNSIFFLVLFFHWGFVSATNSYCIKTRYQQISGQLYAGKLFLALEKYILSQRNINFPGRFLSLKLETLPGHWYIKKPCEPALYFGMCHNVVMILMFLMPLLSQSNTKFEQKQEITVWLSIPFATFYTMYLVKNFFANRYWGNSWTTCGWHCVFPVPWE